MSKWIGSGTLEVIGQKGKTLYYRIMLSFSFAIAFIMHLLLFCTAPMVTPMMEEMDLSHGDFGVLYSSAMLSLILFRIPWGLLGDRIGYLNTFRIVLPLSAASAVLRAFSPNYLTLLLCQFSLGLTLAAMLPCLPLIVKEWSPGTLGFSTGIYISGFAAGNATALGITPYLLETMGWRHVLLLYSGPALIISILWWSLARSRTRGTSESLLKNLTESMREKVVWVWLFFIIASMGSYDSLATWMPKVLEMKEVSKPMAVLLPLGFFVAGPVAGFVSDRFRDRKRTVAILGAVATASILGISYAPTPVMLLCLFLSGFSIIGVLTITLTLPVEHERLSFSAGSVVGFISSLGNIGPLLMPVTFGLLIDVTGTFRVSLLFVAVVVGVTFILGSRVRE